MINLLKKKELSKFILSVTDIKINGIIKVFIQKMHKKDYIINLFLCYLIINLSDYFLKQFIVKVKEMSELIAALGLFTLLISYFENFYESLSSINTTNDLAKNVENFWII